MALESDKRKLTADTRTKQETIDKLTRDLTTANKELKERQEKEEEMRQAIAGTLGGYMKGK